VLAFQVPVSLPFAQAPLRAALPAQFEVLESTGAEQIHGFAPQASPLVSDVPQEAIALSAVRAFPEQQVVPRVVKEPALEPASPPLVPLLAEAPGRPSESRTSLGRLPVKLRPRRRQSFSLESPYSIKRGSREESFDDQA